MNRNPQAPADPSCIECGGTPALTTGAVVYPHRPDLRDKLVWLCTCGAKCGCHPGTVIPLGRPCGPDTARARDHAHRAFDTIWRRKMETTGCRQGRARGGAYKWLARELGIRPEDCHISHMDRAACERVIALCEPIVARIRLNSRRRGTSAPRPGSIPAGGENDDGRRRN